MRRALNALFALFLLITLPAQAWATAYTSAAAGNWATAANWTPNGVPGDGDTVTVAHAITVDVDTTVGNDNAAGVPAVQWGPAGNNASVTVAAGKTLRVKGDIKNASAGSGGLVTVSAGATLAFYPASGTSNVFAVDSYYCHLVCNGTSGSHATVTTDKSRGGNNAYMTMGGGGRGGLMTATYTDFSHFGDGSNAGMYTFAYPSPFDGDISVTNCTFSDCGWRVGVDSSFVSGSVTVTDNTFASAAGTYTLDAQLGSISPTTGTWSVLRNRFLAQPPNLYGVGGMHVDNNYFDHNISTNYQGTRWASFDGNFVRKPVAEETTLEGGASNSYWLNDNSGQLFGFLCTASGDATYAGNLFQSRAPSGDTGYAVATTDQVAADRLITVTGNLLLPGPSGGGIGAVCQPNTFAAQAFATTVVVNHNTAPAASTGALLNGVGSGTAQRTNVVTAFKSNLIFGTGAPTLFAMTDPPGSGGQLPVTDTAPAANVDHNGYCSLAKVTSGYWHQTGTPNCQGATPTDVPFNTPYQSPMSGATVPGANDVDMGTVASVTASGPKFVDPTRNLQAWAVSRGYVAGGASDNAKVTAALAAIQGDPTLTKTDLIPWVRAGFAPTAAALHNAAHDGADIGAVAWTSAANPVPVINGGLRRRASMPSARPPVNEKPLRRKAG